VDIIHQRHWHNRGIVCFAVVLTIWLLPLMRRNPEQDWGHSSLYQDYVDAVRASHGVQKSSVDRNFGLCHLV